MSKMLPVSLSRILASGAIGAMLVTGLFIWNTTPATAGNEVFTSGIRCNNKQSGGQEFNKDWYVYFETNSSKVRPEDYDKIRHIYGIAKGHHAQQICLFGKASKAGDVEGNTNLGIKRARNVAREFEALGWSSKRIAIGTEGEAWGWMTEMLTSDAKEDRRVLIRLSN
ncbi:MAG: OmpA family protein [Parvibaculum sp.]